MILLCYDGSKHAQVAADTAAQLFPRAPVTVLCVWEPFIEVMAQSGFGGGYPLPIRDADEIDAAIREQATATARDGADRVRHAGMASEPRVEARGLSVAGTILDVANEIDADAVVVGTRGLGGVKSLLLGSVSQAVVHQTDRPVVVVPSDAQAPGGSPRRATEAST
jgi:nucleotide-binding universal stress UspA family protein